MRKDDHGRVRVGRQHGLEPPHLLLVDVDLLSSNVLGGYKMACKCTAAMQ